VVSSRWPVSDQYNIVLTANSLPMIRIKPISSRAALPGQYNIGEHVAA
jgi:hypothetical protein